MAPNHELLHFTVVRIIPNSNKLNKRLLSIILNIIPKYYQAKSDVLKFLFLPKTEFQIFVEWCFAYQI